MIFDITVNKVLDPNLNFTKVSETIKTLYPNLICYDSEDILGENRNIDLNNLYTWFDIEPSLDIENWASVIHFHFFPTLSALSVFPQIKIAEGISESFNCNCLCDVNGVGNLIANLSIHDPYWTLAYINQQWYFADTAGMKIMGPYTDGVSETPGDAELNLLCELDLTYPKENMYDYNTLKLQTERLTLE